MAKFWQIFKKLEESASQEEIEEVKREIFTSEAPSAVDKQAIKEAGLRLGMWVSTPSGIGIVKGIVNGTISVALVDDAGWNKQILNFEPGKVQQAKLAQIPASRRQTSVEVFKALGY